MVTSVSAAFEDFRVRIEPENYERETATNRKDELVSLLENDFTVLDSFATGSLPRYTAVAGHADLDIMVVLDYEEHIKGHRPSYVLQAVRDHLGEYRPQVRKNGQAVTLYYKSWPNVDVVPVAWHKLSDDTVDYYEIPDMNTESWIRSRPRRHDDAMTTKNKRFGVEFKRIIKMIKWWNYQHSELLESYHIEVLALNALRNKFSGYPEDIYTFFKNSEMLIQEPLKHLMGGADAYLDKEMRQEAAKRIVTACEQADRARQCTDGKDKDHEEAIEIYGRIFGEEFPSYG